MVVVIVLVYSLDEKCGYMIATIMKQGSNQAVRIFAMETLYDKYRGGDLYVKVSVLLTGVFGDVADAVSVFGNTPIDVIKTQMQVRCVFVRYTGFSNRDIHC